MATLANQSQANLQSFGQNGFNVVTGTAAQTGNYSAITIVTDTVVASITATNIQLNGSESATALSGVTLPAGTTIFGKITGFTLTSGSVIAYYAV
jgi:hypothetical protein